MAEGVNRYPLSWPVGWLRTKCRQRATFGKKSAGDRKRSLSIEDAFRRLEGELQRLGAADGAVVSTNLRLRLDGLPRGDQGEPSDTGVAVYFRLKKQDRCLACDRFYRVADNIAAIAAHVEALRAIERYGVGTLDQAFAGYTALPSRVNDAIAWWDVLRIERYKATPDSVNAAFKALALTHHPDRGGNTELMTKITLARDAALRELRGEK